MPPLRARWLAGALLAALALPAAGADAPGFLEATASVDVAVETTRLTFEYPPPTEQELPTGGLTIPTATCGTGHLVADPGGRYFRFGEDNDENGCGLARLRADILPGSRSATLAFSTNRLVGQPAFDPPKEMVQELWRYDAAGEVVQRQTIFTPDADSHLLGQAVAFEIPLDLGQRTIELAWWFFDQGESLGGNIANPALGQRFEAVVDRPVLRFAGLPASVHALEAERLGVRDDAVATRTTVHLALDPELAALGATTLSVRVQDDLRLESGNGPDGRPLPTTALSSDDIGGERVITIGRNGTSAGPGTYTLRFTSTAPLEPVPFLVPFALAVLFVPAGAGALALRNSRRLAAQAPPDFQRSAHLLDRTVLAALLAYLILPVAVLVFGRLALLSSWPLDAEAGLIYIMVGLSFLTFLVLDFTGRRGLARLVEDETAYRKRAGEELERSNRDLEQFAYVASHDLQEPLRMVASYTELLRRRYHGKLDKEADEFIDYAVDGAHRMRRLIDDLLAFSRVGTHGAPFGPVALDEALDEALQNLALARREADARIERAPLPTVHGDRGQLVQVFQNLVGNALKFRKPGEPARVRIACADGEDAWTIRVSDDGIGIDPRHFGKLFVIFQRLQPREAVPGNGIGLALCKRILERHGGHITVESVPGEGATFRFTLPRPRNP